MKRLIHILLMLLAVHSGASAQFTAVDSLMAWHASAAANSGLIQREMIYLHLDNTSYYRGDRIYFACYLVTSGHLKPSGLSKTVYVELLNPNGQVIDRQILKAADGRCHGSLLVEEQPFYSGYYEIRAYTRYMLNFGADAIFSRVIPVYNAPQVEGDRADRSMLEYGSKKRDFTRPAPAKTDKANVKFYPEGGHLVRGLPTRVAFEITDEAGRPLQATGRVVDRSNGSVVATFATGHMGRGAFELTAATGRYRAMVEAEGKRYSVDLPAVESEGLTVRVDGAAEEADTVTVTVSRTPGFPTEIVGAMFTCRGELCGRALLDLREEPTASFTTLASKLPTGVITLTIFDAAGRVVADRMFFHNGHDMVQTECRFDKEQYDPHEPVTLSVSLSRPVPFSIAVTDAAGQVAYGSNMMADLLLSSEIKGYVHKPAYYLDDPEALDRLLMVQGWRRYPWTQLVGAEPYAIDIMPEQGIEVHGRVLARGKDKPLTDVTVAAMINRVVNDTIAGMPLFADSFEVDSEGRFAFSAEVTDDCMLSLSSLKKGKAQPCRILLDTVKRLPARGYSRGEMRTELDIARGADSVATAGAGDAPFHDPHSHLLREVTVTERVAPWDSVQVLENAVARYDLVAERSALLDDGRKLPVTLLDALMAMDNNFYVVNRGDTGRENRSFAIKYKGGLPWVVVKGPLANAYYVQEAGAAELTDISMDYVKDIYISTNRLVLYEYMQRYARGNVDTRRYSCVVFVESGNGLRRSVMTEKGMRRAYIHGYDTPTEFYSPDYSEATPFEPDYRRTLYWNPEVTPESDGSATLRFYNNSSPTRMAASAAAIW